MRKTKYYLQVKFVPKAIEEAHEKFLSLLDTSKPIGKPGTLHVDHGDEEWEFDTIEEFFSEYMKSRSYTFDHIEQGNRLIIYPHAKWVRVGVSFPTRSMIESVFNIFDKYADQSKVAQDTIPTTIFIGHGQDSQWRDLKDHLHDQHRYEVVAYEIGPRAGLSVKEVLKDMLTKSSMAFLVLTGEDTHADGEVHARENVIHELGLFQGRLGFNNAIALLEDGVKEFSNILGINQIRFGKKRIRETFGDVVATIKRETCEE